jgi:hypothetical protein
MSAATAAVELPDRTPPRAPSTELPRPAATSRFLPEALPTGTGRIAAAAAAMAASTTAAWLLGADIPTRDAAALVSGAILLGVAIAFGLRARAIVVMALIAGAAGAAVVAGFDLAGLARAPAVLLVPSIIMVGLMILVLMILVWSIPDVRTIGTGVMVVALVALVSTAWPVLVVLGAYRLGAQHMALPIAVAVAVPLLTWTASSIGRGMALNVGMAFTGIRNGAFHVVLFAGAIAASLYAGWRAEVRVMAMAMETPYESLAPAAGWIVAAGALVLLVWVVVRLPRALARAQLRGRIEALVAGEPILFLTFASLAPFALWWRDPSVPPGRACWIALAGGAAYLWVRVRCAAPPQQPNAPLWIVVAARGDDLRAIEDMVSSVAGAWRAGQVTVLAEPAAATKTSGEHLYASALLGQGAALFPLRLVHLEDWEDAQPPRWTALPVRELYAPSDLWPKILGERLETSTRLVVIMPDPPSPIDPDTPGPATLLSSALDIPPRELFASLRHRLSKTRQPIALFVPRSNAPSIRPDLSAAGAGRLASEVVAGREPILERIRAVQPAVEPVVVRHVIVQCAPGDRPLAEALARRLHGVRDDAGRAIECWVSTTESQRSALRRTTGTPIGVWRHASLLLARLLASGASETGVLRWFIGGVRWLLGRYWSGEFELVVIENGEGPPGFPWLLVELGVRRGVIARVVAIRSAAADASHRLYYRRSSYAGQIRLPSGRVPEAAAQYLADSLLALDLLSIEPDTQDVLRDSTDAKEEKATKPGRLPSYIVALAVVVGLVALIVKLLPLTGNGWPFTQTPTQPQVVNVVDANIRAALSARESRNFGEAIATLTSTLALPDITSPQRASVLRDRAYCFKLQEQWTAAIADLTEVLKIESDATALIRAPDVNYRLRASQLTASVHRDRAFAYLKTTDLEAAIADYDLAATSGDRDAEAAALSLRSLLKPTSGTLFVFLPFGRVNGPAVLPPEAQRLGNYPFINLRFWWHPIAGDEVRYTSPADQQAARDVADRLRAAGLAVKGPTLMSQAIQRDRRIEVWLRRRYEPRASAD